VGGVGVGLVGLVVGLYHREGGGGQFGVLGAALGLTGIALVLFVAFGTLSRHDRAGNRITLDDVYVQLFYANGDVESKSWSDPELYSLLVPTPRVICSAKCRPPLPASVGAARLSGDRGGAQSTH
jgi:hypothetical protein